MRHWYSIGLIATVASTAIAQDCGSIIGSLDTAFNNDVAVEGGYAYIAADLDGLKIVDISDPTTPTLAGTLDTAGRALGIFVADSIVYLADEDGLVVIDATDPTSPELLDAIATPGGRAQNVFVSDGVAGIADTSSGLHLFDVSDPASVSALGAYPSAFTMHDVLLSDGYAYLAGNYAFQVVDISDPTTPTLAGEFEDSFEARGMAFYDNGDIAMADKEGWVWWIDVSDPSNPDDLWSTTSGDAVWDVTTGQGATLAVDRSFGTIEVFDMLVPDRPRDFARAPAGPEPMGIAYADGLAYVANRNFGLTIVDLAGCLPCHADLDADGDLTIFDFLAFQNLFDASNPLADFDGDGAFTIFDFLAFQNDFDAGCV